MAGAVLTVDIDDQATRLYAELAERLGKSRGLMDAIGQQLVSSTLRRFQTQTGPDGKAWAPLSKATLKKRGANAKALQASGRLRQSITFRSTASTVEVGSNLIYAALMQRGGTIEHYAMGKVLRLRQVEIEKKDGSKATVTRFAKGKHKTAEERRVEVAAHSVAVPGRPYLGMSAADERSISRIAHDYVMGSS
jgi:phage virion morphogenesis protein